MATTKITSPDLFDLGSLNTALKLPSGTTAERPTSPSTGEWRYNTTTNLVEFWDGGAWRDLQSENIPPINSENFNTVTYTGNGSTQSITGVGFKPDFVWIKPRNFADNHVVSDSTRGVNKSLAPNTDAAEQTTLGVTSFDADGFSLPNWGNVNSNGDTFVAWCWKANGGTTSSNTDGSVTSTVQANTKAGFSIVTATAPASGVFTVGHGLNAEIDLYIIKSLSTGGWVTYVRDLGADKYLRLDTADAAGTSTNFWDNTNPTSSVFTMKAGSVIVGTANFVAYCFKSIDSFSKIGTYTGNSSSNVISTGFEPAFLMIKRTNSSGWWNIWDNKRNTTNPRNTILSANLNSADLTSTSLNINFLTNGFELTTNNGDLNENGSSYIYIAFASDASAAPALPDSFAIKNYSGNGGTQSITGLGFSPSMVWLKSKSFADNHNMADTVRGPLKYVFPNSSDLEFTSSNYLSSFDSDGFTLGNDGSGNASGQTFVAWNWKANSIPTINTDGTIQSLVSANQAAGFSIVKWTTNGSASQFVGHGLSVAPSIIIYKRLDGSQDWFFETDIIGGSYNYLNLNTTAAAQAGGAAWSTRSTSTTISAFTSSNNFDYIAYCFSDIPGYSKSGSYTSNASTKITTGFQPDFLIFKYIGGGDWYIQDSTMSEGVTGPNGGDLIKKYLEPNNNTQQLSVSTGGVEIMSDGFYPTNWFNTSTGVFYMAFKANPAQYPIPSGQMGYLTVAGGASGGSRYGGGGGAGGLRTTYGTASGGGAAVESNITLASGTYTITVGAGGAETAASTGAGGQGNNGSNSTLDTVTSIGGGAGAGWTVTALSGGSGGGGSIYSAAAKGSGTTGQGFAGGDGSEGAPYYVGGGGGASQVGDNGDSSFSGDGGNGLTVAITGSNVTYAGGGGGGYSSDASADPGSGGAGGGASGGPGPQGNGNAGTANTGGGGGGSAGDSAISRGGAGGSGIVVLRMNTSDFSGATSGSPTISAIGSETILQYLASGSYVHNPSTAAGTMNYMVLAGGASGGSNGGGGGSGGLRSSWYASGGGGAGETPLTLSSGTYTITIGGGGAETTVYQNAGTNGTATTISGNATVNTVGGGGGGSNNNSPLTGGSGGGSGSGSGGSTGAAGTAGEGFAGGNGMAASHPYTGGGGGGTGAIGGEASGSGPGAGGNGAIVSITGTAVSYGGGGGGTGGTGVGYTGPGGAGGTGGGGAGGAYNTTGIAATVNTGGGGGASGDNTGVGGAGGSGKVILRLITSEYSGTTTGSPTVTTVGTETVLTFTGSGTYVHS